MDFKLRARSWVFTYHYGVDAPLQASYFDLIREQVEEKSVGALEEENLQAGLEILNKLKTKAIYLCFGYESCPTTGRKHLQGYVRFRNASMLATLIKQSSTKFHWEVAKGSAQQNIDYTSKTGSHCPAWLDAATLPGDEASGAQKWEEWGDRPDDDAHLKGIFVDLEELWHDVGEDNPYLKGKIQCISLMLEEFDFSLFPFYENIHNPLTPIASEEEEEESFNSMN